MRWTRWWALMLLLPASCGPPATIDQYLNTTPAGTPPIPLIVDYSPTVSDVGGLMFLLSHPRVDLLAISMSEAGEAGCDLGVEVTLGILAMFDREDIPVACDPNVPAHAHEWPDEFLAGHEHLADGLPASSVTASSELPSDLVARIAAGSDRPVTVYAVSPLTVVAKALSEHPSLAEDIERIVIMGGAVDVPGNVFGSDAEWNVYIDTRAAAAVIGSGIPVTLVPLDATNEVPVPDGYPGMVSPQTQSDAIAYLGGLIDRFPAVTSGFYYLWDELAASVAAGERFTTFEKIPLTVVVGGAEDGRTVRSDGPSVTVATGVEEPDLFYQHFLDTLAAPG